MMTKISGILPSNRRITSTDIQNERPLRPGVPSFGQPIAPSANPRDEFQRVAVSAEELANYSAQATLNPKLQKDLETVNRVSDGFFRKSLPVSEIDMTDLDMSEEAELGEKSLDVRI